MIVKNEEQVLPRLADSVRHQIDHWTIVDTGSHDRTIETAQQAFAGTPGEIVQDIWRGYGKSRNVAIEYAEGSTDWLLTLDADEIVTGDIRSAVPLLPSGVDCVEAELRYEGLSLWSPRLFRSRRGWRWHGRAHEYLASPRADSVQSRTHRFGVIHYADGGNRADKLERELALLLQDRADDPDNARTVFYLARTYDDMGRPAEAAKWYDRRVQLGGWEEERWYAQWRHGACLLAMDRTDEACGVLWRSFGERPWRAEPLSTLAAHYRVNALWRLCWETCEVARRSCGVLPGRPGRTVSDRLFVHSDVYRWGIAYEQSIAAWYVGEYDRGRMLCDYLLGVPGLPDAVVASVRDNKRFYWGGDDRAIHSTDSH